MSFIKVNPKYPSTSTEETSRNVSMYNYLLFKNIIHDTQIPCISIT